MLEKLLRRKGIVPWESLNDLPENVPYAVTGFPPANLFSKDRPMILSRIDQMVGPMILHDSRRVDTRLLMAITENFNHSDSIGIGDVVMRVGDKLNLQEKHHFVYPQCMRSATS